MAVQVKDSGGKTFVKTLKIAITNANDAPTVSNAIFGPGLSTEGSALSFQFNTNVFADVDSIAASIILCRNFVQMTRSYLLWLNI